MFLGGAGGENELMIYAKLIYLLGQSQPVYGLQIYGLEGSGWQGEHGFHPNVESLAAVYIQEIRQVQPNSPYIIGGECAGGVIAFEIAQQLLQQGEEVSLILMDTLCPINRNTSPVSQQFSETINTNITNKSNAQLIKEAHANYKAIIRSYQPQTYAGEINLIVSQDNAHKKLVKNWQLVAKQDCKTYEVPGDHNSYLGDFFTTTARQLKACLDSLQTKSNFLEINPAKSESNVVLQQSEPNNNSNLVNQEITTLKNLSSPVNNFWQLLNEQERMAAVYQKALKLSPNNPHLYQSLGNLAFSQGNLEEARAFYQKALELDPQYFWAYKGLGDTLTHLQQTQTAMLAYEKAIELEPNNHYLYLSLGGLVFKQGNFEKAKSFYQKAIELDPQYFWAYKGLGDALTKLQQPEAAMLAYQKAIELDPNNHHLYVSLGNLAFNQSNLEEAKSFYQKSVELDPQYFWGYKRLGDTLRKQGKIDQSIEIYKQALELNPDHPQVRRFLKTIQ